MSAWILNKDVSRLSQFAVKVIPKMNHFSRHNRVGELDRSHQFLLSRRAKSKIRQLSKMWVLQSTEV